MMTLRVCSGELCSFFSIIVVKLVVKIKLKRRSRKKRKRTII